MLALFLCGRLQQLDHSLPELIVRRAGGLSPVATSHPRSIRRGISHPPHECPLLIKGNVIYRRYFSATSRKRAALSSTTSSPSRIVTPKAVPRPASLTPMPMLIARATSASVCGSMPFQ